MLGLRLRLSRIGTGGVGRSTCARATGSGLISFGVDRNLIVEGMVISRPATLVRLVRRRWVVIRDAVIVASAAAVFVIDNDVEQVA